ncbi:MAG: protein kinase [Thermoanaerobaculia bacterium]|nr:protein kinase [Thermoanaerobaculia bacterium]
MLERKWSDVDQLFAAALDLSPEKRRRLLSQHDQDPEVAAAVAKLLAFAEEPFELEASSGTGALDMPATALAELCDLLLDAMPDTEPPGAGAIGPYRLIGELGRGGMGVVYEAEDERLGRRVALKVLRGLGNKDHAEARFQRESRAAAALDHPNICALHDIGTTADGAPYLVLSLCRGRSLADLLADGPTSIEACVTLGTQVARGLQCAHDAGIVHRDIKPSNLMLDERGDVKILDFGIATIRAEGALTKTGWRLGTPQYMAPEQRKAGDVDHRCDIWALGAVLWEMLAGEPAIDHTPTAEVLGALRPEAPAPLVASVVKALSARPADRQQSAAELAGDLARARSGSSTGTGAEASSGNLPKPATPLFGRGDEIAQALDILGGCRLLTLAGPGGIGKTRLALGIAEQLAAGGHDVTYLDLTPILDPELVPISIARALGAPAQHRAGVLEGIRAAVGDRRLILVLDNFEQVVAAAKSLAELLTLCPGLKIVVTSRMVLRLSAERVLAVPPLAVPSYEAGVDPETLLDFPATRLLVERARSAAAAFSVDTTNAAPLVGICRRLEGLPLALELAAPWLRLFSPAALLQRLERRLDLQSQLRDVPGRHAALRAAMEWSHELLSPDDALLFRHLAVFSGGFTIDGAAAVRTGADGPSLLTGLSSLIDQSLISRHSADPDRFVMLESLRELGLEKLREHGEEASAREAHAGHYLELVASARLSGPEQAHWMEVLTREHDNVRAAFDWLVESPRRNDAFRLGAVMWRFWLSQGHAPEGARSLARLCAAVAEPTASEETAKTLHGLGMLQIFQGRNLEAREAFERALRLCEEMGNEAAVARELCHLAMAENELGHANRAEPLAARSLEICLRLGETAGAATAHTALGWITGSRGQLAACRDHYRRSLAGRRRHGDPRNIAFTLATLGWVEAELGDLATAKRHVAEARRLTKAIHDSAILNFARAIAAALLYIEGSPKEAFERLEASVRRLRQVESGTLVVWALDALANARAREGELLVADDLFAEEAEWARSCGAQWALARAELGLGRIRLAQDRAGAAEELFARVLAVQLANGAWGGCASAIEGLAATRARRGERHRAAELVAAAATLREQEEAAPIFFERAWRDNLLTELRSGCEPRDWEHAWESGRCLAPHQVLERL